MGRLRPVDHVPEEGWQFVIAEFFDPAGAGLGELPCDPRDPQRLLAGGGLHVLGEQVDESGLALNVPSGALGWVLRTIPGLQHLHLAGGDAGQVGAEVLYLRRGHQRCDR